MEEPLKKVLFKAGYMYKGVTFTNPAGPFDAGGRLDAERRSLLAVASLVVLAEDVAQNFRHTVDSQLPPDGQSSQKLNGACLPQERLKGEGNPCEVLCGADFVELAAILKRQFLPIVYTYLSANTG